MPVTVHKLLMHGPEIIKNAIVPIGMLSDDAQEANHKYFRGYRENFPRKFSRKANNRDILNNLLIHSDPLISYMRPTFNMARSGTLPDEVKEVKMIVHVMKKVIVIDIIICI